MSKNYSQIANDVMTGENSCGRRAGRSRPLRHFDGGDDPESHRHENEGTHGARDRHRGSLRRLRRLPHQDGPSTRATRRRSPRRLLLPCTWVADRRRFTERTRCAHTISLPAQSRNTRAVSQSNNERAPPTKMRFASMTLQPSNGERVGGEDCRSASALPVRRSGRKECLSVYTDRG